MISDRQMKRTLMIELFSTTGLFVSAMAQNLQQLAVGIAAALLYAGYFLWIGRNYDIYQIGKIRKAVYTIRFFVYACFLGSFLKVLVSKMLLGGGSGWFLFLPVFVLTVYANRGGREERARLLELLFWFIFVPLFVVLFLAAKDIHFAYLVEGEASMSKSIQVFLCFSTLEILLFFHGKIAEKGKALAFVFGLNLIIFLVTIGMYGGKIAQNSLIPVVTMIQMVRFPGGFVERLDILLLAFWILSLYAIFSAYCFYGIDFWRRKEKISVISFFFYALVFGIVSFNQMDFLKLMHLFQTYLLWFDLPLAIILPLLKNTQNKKAVAVTMVTVLIFIVTGCAPAHVNIEERAYVLALGIEKEKETWKVTFFLPDHAELEVTGKDFAQVKKKFQKASDKELELGHLKAMIVKKGSFTDELKEEWKKEEEYAKTILVFTTQEEIGNIRKLEQKKKDSLGSFLVELSERNKKEVTLGDYFAGREKVPELCIRKGILILG